MTATSDRPVAPADVEGAPRPGRPLPVDAGDGRAVAASGRWSRYLASGLVLGLTLALGFVAGRLDAGRAPARSAAPQPAAHAAHAPGGLQVSQDGYTLALGPPALSAGRAGELAFRIVDATGAAVTRFRTTHERLMHLVLVGRDLTGYRHVHPELSPDGTWRVRVTPEAPGPLRAIADFWPADADRAVTLGVDVPVPGRYAPRPPAEPQETIVVDGYTVTLDGGLRPGESNQVLVWLGRDGKPVGDLQPHLGAYGHLVALRHGDLAYLHVHPAAASRPESVVAFGVTVPSAGTYRLFFEFRHRDVVHVAEFTVTA
ncbi:hypothetical protein E1193_05655 [Micromonospora sp. KC606]|uniref:hypothetical protein n=1 Tax=Micromonospora sp. KC606 TaxID=2530379 RepID=UPI00104ECEFF|nr:hypothetical protein [Micromonospora sp. KC606]TDC84427.1 hypothetical protein E1193_05655 [Micromonospora sp. KC606]